MDNQSSLREILGFAGSEVIAFARPCPQAITGPAKPVPGFPLSSPFIRVLGKSFGLSWLRTQEGLIKEERLTLTVWHHARGLGSRFNKQAQLIRLNKRGKSRW